MPERSSFITSELSSGKPKRLKTSTNFRFDIPSSAKSRTQSALPKGTRTSSDAVCMVSRFVEEPGICLPSIWGLLVAGRIHHLDRDESSEQMTALGSSLSSDLLTAALPFSCKKLQTLHIQPLFGKSSSGLPGHHSTY